MSHVDILLDFSGFFYLEFFVKNVIRFLRLNGSLPGLGWVACLKYIIGKTLNNKKVIL